MDFLEVLHDARANVAPQGHHHTRSGWINFDCPYCGQGSNRFHMGYNTSGKYLNCWRCGPKRISDTLVLLGMDPKQAYLVYKELPADTTIAKPARDKLVLPKADELLPAHKRYLKQRKFDPDELVRLWDIRGIGLHSKLAWRILIPIYYRGNIVSWTSRAIGEVEKRYHSASEREETMNHKELLYGEDYVRHSVIIHEGPTDVWATGPGAVGTFGVGYTASQVLKLSKYPVRVVCFDKGTEAQQRANKLCDLLDAFPGSTYNVQLESGDDPASADKEELETLRRQFL